MLTYFRLFALLWVLLFGVDSLATKQYFTEDSKREIGAGSEPNGNQTPKPSTTTIPTTITSTETSPSIPTSTTLEPNPFVRPTKILLTGAEPVEGPVHTPAPSVTTSTETSHSKTTSTELPPQTPQITSTSTELPPENVTAIPGMETNTTDVDVPNLSLESSTVSGINNTNENDTNVDTGSGTHSGVTVSVSPATIASITATVPGGSIGTGTNGNSGMPTGTGSSGASQEPASSASSVTTQGLPVGTGSTSQPGIVSVVSQEPVTSASSVTTQGMGTESTSPSEKMSTISVPSASIFTSQGPEMTTEACVDSVPNCDSYPTSICNASSPYYRWATAHCQAYCGFCIAITTPHVCVDHIDNCNMYSEDLCVNSLYKKFVKENCEAYCCRCGGCSPPTPSAPVTPAPTQDFNNVTTCNDLLDNCDYYDDENCFNDYEPWAKINCALRCYYCVGKTPTCIDYDPFCNMYAPGFCQQFSGWSRTNCKKTCGMCGPPQNPLNATGSPGDRKNNMSFSEDIQETPPASEDIPETPKAPRKRKVLSRKRLYENSIHDDDECAKDGFENDLVIDELSDEQTSAKKISCWDKCSKCEGEHLESMCPEKDPVCQLDIGNNVFVVVNKFKGERLIHIRVYKTESGRPMYPTKQGIALDLEKWSKLVSRCKDDVDKAIASYKADEEVDYTRHLGSNYRVTLKSGFPVVHIRRWFLPENEEEIRPTRKGIALKFDQWDRLKDAMICVDDFIGDEIEKVQYCEMGEDHQNQEGAMMCPKCNPNGDWGYDY